jgi:uncharacterized protein (TIGR03067 family)
MHGVAPNPTGRLRALAATRYASPGYPDFFRAPLPPENAMYTSVLLGLFTGLVVSAPAPPAESDQKKFQGEWTVTSHITNGEKRPNRMVETEHLFVQGAKMTTREGNEIKDEATFTLDPRAKPRAIDLKLTGGGDKGKTVAGIYKLQGDTLTICVAEPGRKRPEDFTSDKGSGHILLVFKRAKR